MEAVFILSFIIFSISFVFGTGLIIGFISSIIYSKYYYDKSEKNGSRNWVYFKYIITYYLFDIIKKYYFDYSIINKVKKEGKKNDDDDDKIFIYANHPHGLFALSSFFLFATLNKNQRRYNHNILIGVHKLIFYIPILRDIALWLGAFDIEKNNIEDILINKRNSIAIVPGGVREMIIKKSSTSLKTENRHNGFLKIAFEHKISVIPIYHKNENILFKIYTNNIIDSIRLLCIKLIGYPFPSFFWGPYPKKLTSYILSPVNPEDYENQEQFIETYYYTLNDFIKNINL